jgi:hypothetical protein
LILRLNHEHKDIYTNGRLPIYVVDKNNIASFKIAKSIGLRILYDEIYTICNNKKLGYNK